MADGILPPLALEKSLPGFPDRPADVLMQSDTDKRMAVDVTVIHPLRPSNNSADRGHPAKAAETAEHNKMVMYASTCEAHGWSFRPFGIETTGAYGPSAVRTMRQLQRYLSMRSGQPLSVVAMHAQEVLSTAVAKGRAEMLLAARPPPTDTDQ